MSRLYAAGFGLAVNPMDARKRLEARAGELYSPRASKPAVNALAAQMRDLKLEIAALESQAVEYADEQARLTQLAEQVEPLRNRRDDLDARLHVAGTGCGDGLRPPRRSSSSSRSRFGTPMQPSPAPRVR